MSHSRDSRKWYEKKRWIIGSLLLFPPLGIPLVWLTHWPRWVKIAGTVLSGWLLLSVVVGAPPEPQVRETPSPSVIEEFSPPISSPMPTPSGVSKQSSPTSASSNKFQFPLPSCGDQATQTDVTWYPVFVDGGNLEAIRRQYCADAISTTREQTGKPTIQVASFANYDKAQAFAAAVGGEVGQPSSSGSEIEQKPVQATSVPTSTPSSSPSPAVGSPIRPPYTGSCDCPYDLDSAGRQCGARSAYSRPGGESPVCYVGE
jgi:hypothetical protein